ncbi:MAG: alpha/beta hydrolase [Candidatus Yanofskybacteria bacterium]|nr:alpha/beta hydrolase [Candidatus Yanofskybacteria bacterium]
MSKIILIFLVLIIGGVIWFGRSDKNSVFAPDTYSIYENILYKQREGFDANLTSLDIYTSPDFADKPAIIMLHGGGWYKGDKSNSGVVRPKAEYFIDKGFVFISINYRLTKDNRVNHPDNVEDVAAAISWIYSNISQYGGRGNQLYLMGHSAGAHLASLVSTDHRYLQSEDIDPSIIKGVIALDTSLFDLVSAYTRGPAIRNLIEPAFTKTDVASLQDGSPIAHIESGKSIPSFLILFAAERGEEGSPGQSQTFYEKLIANGYSANIKGVANKSHSDMNKDVGKPNDPLTIEIESFLTKIHP